MGDSTVRRVAYIANPMLKTQLFINLRIKICGRVAQLIRANFFRALIFKAKEMKFGPLESFMFKTHSFKSENLQQVEILLLNFFTDQ